MSKNYANEFRNLINNWAIPVWPQKRLYLYEVDALTVRTKGGQAYCRRRVTNSAPVDYIGTRYGMIEHQNECHKTIIDLGISVYLEAKTFACPPNGWEHCEFPLGNEKIVKPHQRNVINLHDTLGSFSAYICGIYKLMNFVKIVLVKPAVAERLLKEKQTKSVTFGELDRNGGLIDVTNLQTLPEALLKVKE